MPKRFVVEYQHKGATYGGVEVVANDWDEAMEMVHSIRFTARIVGSDVIEFDLGKAMWFLRGAVVALVVILLMWAAR